MTKRLMLALSGAASIAAVTAPAMAQQQPFSIRAGDLKDALDTFARQAHRPVIYRSQDIRGARSPGFRGNAAPETALTAILSGSGFAPRYDPSGAVAIVQSASPGADRTLRKDAQDMNDAGAAPEIIVTGALRRDQKILKVPASITAYDKAAMDRQGVRSIDDLVRLTPGLSNIATSSYGGKTISIRGINSNTGASTTGIYIDDTPVQTRNYLGVVNNGYPLVFDIDRVEVLRGPQGTLFGSGAEGGAVRFVTPTPSLDSSRVYGRADLSFTDGGSPSGEFGVAVDTPLVTDRVGLRISAWGRHSGGYIDHADSDGDTTRSNTNSENDVAVRAVMKIRATDTLTITPSLYYQDADRRDIDLYWPDAGRYKSTYGILQPDHDRFVLPALNIDYDAGAFTVKSVTAYYDRRDDRVEDYAPLSIGALTGGTMTSVPGVDFHERSDTITRQKNWSQELRLTSRDDGNPFNWVVGFFFQNSTQHYDQTEVDNIGDLLPVLFPGWDTASFYGRDQLPGNISFTESLTYRTRERAAFGELSYKLTDRLKASAGLRVAHNKFSFTDAQDGPFVGPDPLFYSGSQSETPVTPRFNLSWQGPDTLLYATAAKGYRIGGANPQVPVTCAADLATLGLTAVPSSYKSDSLWSYEAGAKGKVLNGKLQLAGSLFWVDWSGIQANVPLSSCGFGYNANLGNAASRGFDLQAQATPVRGLTLTGSVGYTKATYSKNVYGATPDGADSPTLLAKKGDDLGTPRWQLSLSGEYTHDLAPDLVGYFYGAWQYSSDYHRTGSADVNGYNPYTYTGAALSSVNLRAGLRRGDWDVSAYIDNLLNNHTQTYYYRHEAAGPESARAMTMRPFTAGLTLTFRN